MNARMEALAQLDERLARFPRVRLAHLPTPLEECGNLARAVRHPILVKRDDLTGLAFGGNKVRHFEFLLADALAQEADVIVAGLAAQSNFCRQLAAAAAKLGLECRLPLRVVRGNEDARVQGNLLLDVLSGAVVTLHEVDAAGQQLLVDQIVGSLRAAGRRPYLPDRHPYLGSVSYISAGVELARQLEERGDAPAAIYITSSGGESQAGLLVAMRAIGIEVPVVGVNPGVDWWDVRERGVEFANRAAEELQLDLTFGSRDFALLDELDSAGYGITSARSVAALRELAELEGLYLDPVYTSKTMAVLLEHLERDMFSGRGPVVFVHTGGLPALFHYQDELTADALAIEPGYLEP